MCHCLISDKWVFSGNELGYKSLCCMFGHANNFSMTLLAGDAHTEHLLPTAESFSPYNLTNLDGTSSQTTAYKPLPEGSIDDIELTTYDNAASNLSPHRQNDTCRLYDPAKTSYRTALGGLAFSTVFAILCVGWGTATMLKGYGFTHTTRPINAILAELQSLCLNLLVTLCTESIGFVHAKSLQAALISEHKIQFNTNLRLITGTPRRSWTHPNGTLCNVIMAILLVLSYVSSSLVFISLESGSTSTRYVEAVTIPSIILGSALLLQIAIACLGMRRARILTWSSSPFHTTAALLYHNQLIRKSGKCMHSVSHSDPFINPCTPAVLQPSAWQAHPSIKRIVIALWCLGPACAIWSAIVIRVGTEHDQLLDNSGNSGVQSWLLLPNQHTSEVILGPILSLWGMWVMTIVVMAGLQGPLTMGLHCCELLVNLLRDEAAWRKAVGRSGVTWLSNPLFKVLVNWRNVGLLVAKSVLRELLFPLALYHSIDFGMHYVDWMFGLSLNVYTGEGNDVNARRHNRVSFYEQLSPPPLIMRPVQVSVLACILMTNFL
jgi:hypothetical protein